MGWKLLAILSAIQIALGIYWGRKAKDIDGFMPGLASSMQQSPVKAFTISFDNKDYDEAHIAKEMSDRVNAGLFDTGRLKNFIQEYKRDNDPVSFIRKNALINHILGIQILNSQFISKHATIV